MLGALLIARSSQKPKSWDQLDFTETDSPELSTISTFSQGDTHAASRINGKHYAVETVSLNHLLAHHSAPKAIDYLSIDTEGSELEILSRFDFTHYNIGVITIENGFNSARRQLVFELLNARGYDRIFEYLSIFDDWYVKRDY